VSAAHPRGRAFATLALVLVAVLWLDTLLLFTLPAIVGEALLRKGLREWPRGAVLAGALVAWLYVAWLAVLAPLCGVGDEVSRACDRMTEASVPVTWCFASVTVALTVLACAWPRRRELRYALWSTPGLMALTFVAVGQL
jgi:hypothetical protein